MRAPRSRSRPLTTRARARASGTVVVRGDGPPTPPTPPTPPSQGLQRLGTAQPLRLGQAVDTVLTNTSTGSVVAGTMAGMAITSGTRGVKGTPAARAALLRETLLGVSRDSLVTAPRYDLRTMKLGMGLAGVAFYNQNVIFLDHMKCAQISTPPATADTNGMPLTLNPDPFVPGQGEALWTIPMPDGRTTPVKFRIIADGDFDLQLLGDNGAGNRISYDVTAEGQERVFTYSGGPTSPDGNFFAVKIIRIRTPATKIAVVRDDEAHLFRAGKKIRPAAAAALKGFAWLRLMNWAGANFANPVRIPGDYISFNEHLGVPFAYQVAICKELGIAGWFNVHIKDTDEDFQAMWPAWDEMLAMGLDVYVEMSNEVWNNRFPQYFVAADRGQQLGLGQGLGVGNENTYMRPVSYCGYRTAQLAKLARGRGYKFIVGCQPSDQAYQEQFILEGIAAVPGSLKSDIWGWSSTSYSSGTLNNAPLNLTSAQDALQREWVANLNYDAAFHNILTAPRSLSPAGTSYSVEANKVFLAASKAIADRHGWVPIHYEFNTLHLNRFDDLIDRPEYDGLFYTMPEHPLMKVVTTINMEVSQEMGTWGATWFDFDSIPANSDHGRFGAYGFPAWDALRDWLDGAA